jgi:membrane fusion protein
MMFRPEALNDRADRLSGDVSIAVPIAWQVIGALIFGGLIVALIFLSLASYSRVEIANGIIVPDKGVNVIMPTRNGIITTILVNDGQEVMPGEKLAMIRAEEDSATGLSSAEQIEAAVRLQDASLSVQMNAANAAAQAQIRQLGAQRAGLLAEIIQIQSQIVLQRELIVSAQKDVDRARVIAERGFVSQRDLRVREETLLSRQQTLSQLSQSLAAKQSAISETERGAAQYVAQAKAQGASLEASRAQVAQQAATTAGSRSYVLRAPLGGKVTALTARPGQPASPQTPLMTIVPSGSVLRAELALPSTAIGFLKKGQYVRLAIDAFPYQRFGTIKGKVITIATSPVSQQASSGEVIAAYPVTVALNSTVVIAYREKKPLISGMSLTARIITQKQSLLEWLFEPLFAVGQR